jgi:hypothetical protein
MDMVKRQPRVKSSKNPVEQEAVDKLIRLGVPGDVLLSLAAIIPGTSNKKLELVPGIEERALRKLPDQIKALADKIEKVNQSPWLASDGLRSLALSVKHPHESPDSPNSTETRDSAQPAAMIFSKIPRSLRLYAEHLCAWLNRYHPVGSYGTDRIRMRTLLTIKLLMLVRDSTGRPCYSEIATLLEAAYRASGRRKTIVAEDLRKLKKNNPRLHLIARFLDASPQNLL